LLLKEGYRGVITASDKALSKLHEWLTQKYFETDIGFRLLANSNDSGNPTYSIKLDRQRQGDEVAEVNGVKFLLDPASAVEFTGYELAYLDGPDGGFVLRKCGGKDEQNERKGIMPGT
jgi:Fe-S cluster assembly iron-binding protein IscA